MIFCRKNPLEHETKKAAGAEKIMTGVAIGGAVGVLLGLFFSPKKGAENRQKAREIAEKTASKSREIWVENAPAVRDFARENAPRARGIAAKIWRWLRSRAAGK